MLFLSRKYNKGAFIMGIKNLGRKGVQSIAIGAGGALNVGV